MILVIIVKIQNLSKQKFYKIYLNHFLNSKEVCMNQLVVQVI